MQQLQNLSSREKTMLIVLCVTLMLAGFYYFLLGPQITRYSELCQELEEKQFLLQKNELILRSKPAEEEKNAETQQQLAEYLNLFGTEFRQGSALVLLGIKATERQVAVDNLEPSAIINHEQHIELPLKLTLIGSYQNVRSLLGDMENLPNLVELRNIKIKTLDSVEEAKQNGLLAIQGAVYGTDLPVSAQCHLAIYSDPSPEGRLYLEQEKIQAWEIGRDNPFAIPQPVSPYTEIPIPAVSAVGESIIEPGGGSLPGGEAMAPMPDEYWDSFFESLKRGGITPPVQGQETDTNSESDAPTIPKSSL